MLVKAIHVYANEYNIFHKIMKKNLPYQNSPVLRDSLTCLKYQQHGDEHKEETDEDDGVGDEVSEQVPLPGRVVRLQSAGH